MVDGDDAERAANAAGDAFKELSEHPKAPVGMKITGPVIVALIPLLGIMLGILFNTYSENRARADEKASREREEQIRRVEIGIETYREVSVAQSKVRATTEECESASNAFFLEASDSDEIYLEDTIVFEDGPGSGVDEGTPVQPKYGPDGEALGSEYVDPELVEAENEYEIACEKADEAFTTLEVALGQALLISPDKILERVKEYRDDWSEWEFYWKDLNVNDDLSGVCDFIEDDDEWSECFDGLWAEYTMLSEKLDESGEELSEAIRQQVLLQLSPETVEEP